MNSPSYRMPPAAEHRPEAAPAREEEGEHLGPRLPDAGPDLELGMQGAETEVAQLPRATDNSATCTGSEADTTAGSRNPSDDAVSDESAKASSRKLTRRSAICLSCMAFSAALTGLLLYLLWPRSPTWEVQTLSVDPDKTQQLMSAVMDAFMNASSVHDPIVVPVNVTARVWNTDYIGAHAMTGQLLVYVGGRPLATAATEPMQVPSRGSTTATALAEAVVTIEQTRALVADLVASNFQTIRPHFDGVVPINVWGVSLKALVSCSVEVTVKYLMPSNESESEINKAVTGHSCTYSIRR